MCRSTESGHGVSFFATGPCWVWTPSWTLALDLFYDSVAERQTRPDRAFLGATTAVDVLLGCVTSPESERRVSRAAVLLLAGAQTDALAAQMHSWEHGRREYLRRGTAPDPELLVGLHRFLMRGLPSMARLMALVGGYRNATAGLDVIKNPPDINHPLVVVPHDVADTTHRWPADSGVVAMMVVDVQPPSQRAGALTV